MIHSMPAMDLAWPNNGMHFCSNLLDIMGHTIWLFNIAMENPLQMVCFNENIIYKWAILHGNIKYPESNLRPCRPWFSPWGDLIQNSESLMGDGPPSRQQTQHPGRTATRGWMDHRSRFRKLRLSPLNPPKFTILLYSFIASTACSSP